MKRLPVRALILGLALALTPSACALEYIVTDPLSVTAAPSSTPAPSHITGPAPFSAYPALGRDGFLDKPLEENGPAFIHMDADAGLWVYIGTDLRVEIQRRLYKEPKRQGIFYFIADVRFKGGQTAAMIFMGDIVMDPGTYHGYTKTRR